MAEKWEVGPTKDVIEALMETLVDPVLPYRVSVNNPPSENAQKSVARQMHAVVLLYNYYHKKQNLDLEFLDFVSFCKLAVKLRPSLISFMNYINGLNGAEYELSATEIAVRNACDIAMSLDASRDAPAIEGYRISKVAVLLIDSKKENCLIRFGAVTDGVWSLIEKEVDESNVDQEIVANEEVRRKRKTDHSKYLQLAYDAVKDVAGIDSSDLVLLENHVVYSLSKKKSAAQFYMMHCSQSFSISQSVTLEFLVESLKGPLVEKDVFSWMTTTLVEYHHMLPYKEFISNWLLRKDLCLPISSGNNAQSTKNCVIKDMDFIDNNSSETTISSSKQVANENGEDHQKKCKYSSVSKEKHVNVVDESENRYEVGNSAKRGSSRITRQKLVNSSDKRERGSLSCPAKPLSQRARVDNATRKRNASGFTKTSSKSGDTRKKPKPSNKVYHQRRKNISSDDHDQENCVDSEVEVVEEIGKSNARKVNEGNCDVPISRSRSETHAAEKSSDQFQTPYSIEADNVLALELLNRKRQELCSRICAMADELALCEYNTLRIKAGVEVGLARRCIESIISESNHLLVGNEIQTQDKAHKPDEHHSNPPENRTSSSTPFLPGRSSCRDLELACLLNNWMMPTYIVRPSSDGKFVSNVVVNSKGLDFSSDSGCGSSPSEARQSAARNMIAKIEKTFE